MQRRSESGSNNYFSSDVKRNIIFSILSLVDWSVGNNLDYNIWDKRNWMEILK